jgi:hypothetical protein
MIPLPRIRLQLSILVMGVIVFPVRAADNFYPMVMAISPVAVQTGKTTECVVEGRYNFHGTYKIFITGTGVIGEVAPLIPKKGEKPPAAKPYLSKINVRFKVAADAQPGIRDVRLATPQGASTLGQIVVVRDPIIKEAANNDTMKTAQPIKLPATVCGAIEKAEDVDFYKFHVEAGTSLTFHVHCHRLMDRMHDLQVIADPILALRDSAGSVLGENDNYFAADPLLHYQFKKAGDYYLEIRDVRYSGNPYWNYCIEINDRPFVTNVFPSRVIPGVKTKLRLVGFNLPKEATASITLPGDAPEGPTWTMLDLGKDQRSNAVPIVVNRLPEILEAAGDNNSFKTAQKIRVPAGISGCIEKENDVDCYAFEAKAGERFSFAVLAQGQQSKLDSILRLRNAKGVRLIENDDSPDENGFNRTDSRIEDWVAPAAGRYTIEIGDVHQRGGPAFVYFLKVTRSAPYFTLRLDTDKTPLAPGTAGVIHARVARKEGFTGPVQLAITGLPKGVTAFCGRILESGTDGCIILRAAPDAVMDAANVRVTGSAVWKGNDGKTLNLTTEARPLQEYYSPGGGRGNYPVEMHTVSIGDGLDLKKVKLSTGAITLKPGETKTIEITIERAKGFNQTVTLAAVYQHLGQIFGNSLPAGVTVDESASRTLLNGGQSQGTIVLKAAADAKLVDKQQVALLAHVSINFAIKFTYSSEPLLITVTK